jgi:anti-sigma B factor antagonist
MQIEVSTVGTASVLRPEGRLNMVAAPHLRETIERLAQDGRSRVVVDLSATSFVDSSGLGALVAGLKKVRQAGGDLRISGAGEQVSTVLRLTNLDRVLRPHAQLDEALEGWTDG